MVIHSGKHFAINRELKACRKDLLIKLYYMVLVIKYFGLGLFLIDQSMQF